MRALHLPPPDKLLEAVVFFVIVAPSILARLRSPRVVKARQITTFLPGVVALSGASLSRQSAIALFRGKLETCYTVIAAETDIEAHRHDLTQINTRPFLEVNNIF
jgi:hypothetical protein